MNKKEVSVALQYAEDKMAEGKLIPANHPDFDKMF